MIKFSACLMPIFLSACSPFSLGGMQEKSIGQLSATSTKSEDVFQNLVDTRTAVSTEEIFTLDSYHFITGGNECKDSKGNIISLENERKINQYKINALDALKNYTENLSAMLSESPDAKTVTEYIDAANGIASVVGGYYNPSVSIISNTTATALKSAVVTGDLIRRQNEIGRIANANRKNIAKISKDLQAGVQPLNNEIALRIDIWRRCEIAKLDFIRKNDTSSLIEIEYRYRQFYDINLKLSNQVLSTTESEKIFSEIPKQHDKIIAEANSPKNNIAAIQQDVSLIKTSLDNIDIALKSMTK